MSPALLISSSMPTGWTAGFGVNNCLTLILPLFLKASLNNIGGPALCGFSCHNDPSSLLCTGLLPGMTAEAM